MGPYIILPPAPHLEPRVKSIKTINLYGVGFCIKFPPPSCLEPRADSININIIDYKQLGVGTRNK